MAYYREGGTTPNFFLVRLVFICGAQLSVGFHSVVNIVTKHNGVGLNGWSCCKWMGVPMKRLSLLSRPGGASTMLVWLAVGSPVPKIILVDIQA